MPTEQAPKGTNEKHFTIAGDGTAHVRAPSGQPQWKFTAIPDRAPTIALAKDPERQARGSLQMSYKIEDDYGVTEAQAHFAARRGDAAEGAAEPRPLFDPPQFPLVLPNARTRNGVGQTVKDLSEDPYAGADVTLTLTAKDEAGNEGKQRAVQHAAAGAAVHQAVGAGADRAAPHPGARCQSERRRSMRRSMR